VSNKQLSVAIGNAQEATVSQSPGGNDIPMSLGQSVINGGTSSVTVIVKLQIPVLPDWSVAE